MKPVLHARAAMPLPADALAPTAPTGMGGDGGVALDIDLRWNAANDSGSGLARLPHSRNGVAGHDDHGHAPDGLPGLAHNTSLLVHRFGLRPSLAVQQFVGSAPASATTLTDPERRRLVLSSVAGPVASGGTRLNWAERPLPPAAPRLAAGAARVTASTATAALTATHHAPELQWLRRLGERQHTVTAQLAADRDAASRACGHRRAAVRRRRGRPSNATSCTTSGGGRGSRRPAWLERDQHADDPRPRSTWPARVLAAAPAPATVTVVPAPTVTRPRRPRRSPAAAAPRCPGRSGKYHPACTASELLERRARPAAASPQARSRLPDHHPELHFGHWRDRDGVAMRDRHATATPGADRWRCPPARASVAAGGSSSPGPPPAPTTCTRPAAAGRAPKTTSGTGGDRGAEHRHELHLDLHRRRQRSQTRRRPSRSPRRRRPRH